MSDSLPEGELLPLSLVISVCCAVADLSAEVRCKRVLNILPSSVFSVRNPLNLMNSGLILCLLCILLASSLRDVFSYMTFLASSILFFTFFLILLLQFHVYIF